MIVYLILFAITLYIYLKQRFTYWKKRGVETIPPNLFFGNVKEPIFLQKNLANVIQDGYKYFKSHGYKYGGLYFFGRPIFIPISPNIIKNILVKDFNYFVDRGIHCDVENKPLDAHIFNLTGEDWRIIRQKLSPAYTSGKLKNMLSIFESHCEVLLRVISKGELKDVCCTNYFERYGMDIIGHVAFGIECNTLESKNQIFFEMCYKTFHPTKFQLLKALLEGTLTNPGDIVKLLTSDNEMCIFFQKLVEDTVKYRRDKNVRANDFLQILIDLNNPRDNSNSINITINQIAAQCFLFFLAAYETSSKALSFALYELSKNQNLQDALRNEINKSEMSYEFIMQNKLLDMTFKETLRHHPPVLYLHRECTKTYQIPETNVVLDKGTIILLSIYEPHHDPEYFPKPEIFDPYRFSQENLEKIKPYTYFPFGEGPRNCIGNRFGMLQVKMTLAKLIKNFKFEESVKTPKKIEFSPIMESLLYNIKGKIHYNITKL